MSPAASRRLLDPFEGHVLQPECQYDHRHVPGDVTLWDTHMTLHNSPPMKSCIASLDDVRSEAHVTGSYTTPASAFEA